MDKETNVGEDGPGNPGLHWIAPLLILLVLVLFGAWFCRPHEPAKPEAPKPVNANANANTGNTNTAPASAYNSNPGSNAMGNNANVGLAPGEQLI